MAEFPLDRLEEGGSRPRDPLPRARGFCSGGYVPRSCKTSEVIQANDVDVIQQSANSINAPAVTGRTKRIPVVDRIAP